MKSYAVFVALILASCAPVAAQSATSASLLTNKHGYHFMLAKDGTYTVYSPDWSGITATKVTEAQLRAGAGISPKVTLP